MATLGEYLQTWKLKLSTAQTVSVVFHLNNKEPKCEMKVNETLPFCSEPKYLGVTLDRSHTYRRHLESLRKKLTSRVVLLRRLAGSGWGAGPTTLQTATLALVHSTAEYCAPVWCRGAYTLINNPTINDALRIVTRCLRPTPADNLPILASNLLSFVPMEPGICSTQRSPFHRVQMHIASNRDTHLYRFNHFRTGVGRFRSCLYKWGMAFSAACECGAEEQTADHVVLQSPIQRPPDGLHVLTVLDDGTTQWLLNSCLEI